MSCCWTYDASLEGAGRYLLYLTGLYGGGTLQKQAEKITPRKKNHMYKDFWEKKPCFLDKPPPHGGDCFEGIRDKTNGSVVGRICQGTQSKETLLFPEHRGNPADRLKFSKALVCLLDSSFVIFEPGVKHGHLAQTELLASINSYFIAFCSGRQEGCLCRSSKSLNIQLTLCCPFAHFDIDFFSKKIKTNPNYQSLMEDCGKSWSQKTPPHSSLLIIIFLWPVPSYCVYLRVKQASVACKLRLWSAHLVKERLVCAECQGDAMSKSDRCGGDGIQSSRWAAGADLPQNSRVIISAVISWLNIMGKKTSLYLFFGHVKCYVVNAASLCVCILNIRFMITSWNISASLKMSPLVPQDLLVSSFGSRLSWLLGARGILGGVPVPSLLCAVCVRRPPRTSTRNRTQRRDLVHILPC